MSDHVKLGAITLTIEECCRMIYVCTMYPELWERYLHRKGLRSEKFDQILEKLNIPSLNTVQKLKAAFDILRIHFYSAKNEIRRSGTTNFEVFYEAKRLFNTIDNLKHHNSSRYQSRIVSSSEISTNESNNNIDHHPLTQWHNKLKQVPIVSSTTSNNGRSSMQEFILERQQKMNDCIDFIKQTAAEIAESVHMLISDYEKLMKAIDLLTD